MLCYRRVRCEHSLYAAEALRGIRNTGTSMRHGRGEKIDLKNGALRQVKTAFVVFVLQAAKLPVETAFQNPEIKPLSPFAPPHSTRLTSFQTNFMILL
jgi:hypothetical protein